MHMFSIVVVGFDASFWWIKNRWWKGAFELHTKSVRKPTLSTCVLFNVLFNYLVWEYSKVVDYNWLHFLFLPWKIASKLLTIHYLSVQLSMITGKGFILEASWLATHLLDKRSRELFTFCARNYCKATFSHAIRVSLFQVVHWLWLVWWGVAAAFKTPRVAKIDGFKRTW